MSNLAKLCGYTSISDLHANEVSMLLNEFTEKKVFFSICSNFILKKNNFLIKVVYTMVKIFKR